MTTGLTFGSSAPGAPPETNGGNFAIVGGTGAFIGMRGQILTAPAKAPSAARSSAVRLIEVTVNGVPAYAVWASGFPGAIDGYQVNFRVPAGVSPGSAKLQLSVAWIAGAEVRLPVQ